MHARTYTHTLPHAMTHVVYASHEHTEFSFKFVEMLYIIYV